MHMKIEYYVFSGTGNTLMVAKEAGKKFAENGYEVNYHMISKSSSFRMGGDCIVGLAFPVAFCSSYPLVLNFIASLPQAKGRKIFMTATMAGCGMGVEGKIRELVTAKGYEPVGSKLFVMPSNYNNKKIPFDKNKKMVDRAMAQAASFAEDLIKGKTKWSRGIPVLPSLSQWFVMSGRAFRFFYSVFPIRIENSKCIKCMRCVENCPASAVEVISEYPVINQRLCQSCQRCAGFCPVHAITVPGKPAEQYRAMEFEEFN